MALTPEQQSQVELQEALESIRRVHEISMDNKRTRLECVRLAKDVLTENDRNKSVGERGISANDITNFAQIIQQYINQ